MLIGVGMGAGLYEAAFSALVRLYGRDSRSAITCITLLAGFASTVGWPLSTLLEAQFGWRGSCLAWAALHLILGLPLNGSLPKAAAPNASQGEGEAALNVSPTNDDTTSQARLAAGLLAFVFAATWFVSTAMATHLPRLLQASGATLGAAIALGALVVLRRSPGGCWSSASFGESTRCCPLALRHWPTRSGRRRC